MAMAQAGFRNSDGWKRMPRSSQRLAPFTSCPIKGTRNNAPSIKAVRTTPKRRAFSRVIMETPSITAMPAICHAM